MRSHLVILFFLILGLPTIGQADKRTDAAFDALRKTGLKKQQAGDFDGALKAYKSAAQLKNTPTVWLNMISLHADRAKKAEKPTAYCAQTKEALSQFFAICTRCTDKKSRQCSSCRMIDPKAAKKSLAVRTRSFAQKLETRGKALRASIEGLSEKDKAVLEYRSTGLIAKSSELNRCIHTVKIESKPAGAIVSQESGAIGRAPVEAPLFIGKETVLLDKPNYHQASKIIEVTTDLDDAVAVTLVSTSEPKTVMTEGSSGKRLAGWISISLGAISLATAGTFTSIAITKRDEAKSINGAFGQQEKFERLKDESRSALTVTGITGGLGLVAVGAGVWLLIDGAPKKETVTSFHVTPTGFFINGRF